MKSQRKLRKLNILYIMHDAKMGGANQSLLDMLRYMKELIVPRVIIPEYGPACEFLERINVPYYSFEFRSDCGEFGKYNPEESELNFWLNYRCAKEIAEYSIKHDWSLDLIHSNSSIINVGAMAAMLLAIPHIWHFREFLEEDFNAEIWDKSLQEKLVLYSSCCIAISDCIRNKYEEKYKVKYKRIYNGLDVEKYFVGKEKDELNRNFLLAGTVQEGKGQAEAILAIDYLVNYKGIKDIVLYIVGYGDERLVWIYNKYIEKKNLNKNVYICEFRSDLSSIREKCAFSLTCSKMEALGRGTIEAMLSRKLVIGADTGGTLEIIGKEQNRGLLYKQGDFVDLANTMLKGMGLCESKYVEYLDKAQDYCIAEFDSREYKNKLYECYEETLPLYKKYSADRDRTLLELAERYGKYDVEKALVAACSKKENKFQNLFYVLYDLIQNNRIGKTIARALSDKGIKKIALYGIGYIGRLLYDELQGTEVEVEYFIDNGFADPLGLLKVYKLREDLPVVDAIIVTVAQNASDIVDSCCGKVNIPVYCVQEFLSNS